MDVWTHKASCVLWHLDSCQQWPEGTEAAVFLASSCIVLILVPLMNTSTSQSNHSTPYIQTYRAKKVSNPETRRQGDGPSNFKLREGSFPALVAGPGQREERPAYRGWAVL